MYGWRARIGLLAPSRGDTMLYEFYKLVPDGVMAVPYSCELSAFDRAEFERVGAAYERGVEALVRERVDLVYIGGTPVQTLRSHAELDAFVEQVATGTGLPVVTSAGAELAAARASTAGGELALLTPYEPETTERIAGFLRAGGVRVAAAAGKGVRAPAELASMSDYQVYRDVVAFARSAPRASSVHVTCPRWPTLGMIEAMEQTLGVPVTSSCQASLWQIFGRLNLRPRSQGWGSLFGTAVSPPSPRHDTESKPKV